MTKRKMTQEEIEAEIASPAPPEPKVFRKGRTPLIVGDWRAGVDNWTMVQLINAERARLVPVSQPSLVTTLLDLLDSYEALWHQTAGE